MTAQILTTDLQDICGSDCVDWTDLKGSRILITGGTGFFGKWLVSGLSFANIARQLDLQIDIVSRQAQPSALAPFISFIAGDVRTFRAPRNARYTHLIHAATPADIDVINANPADVFDICETGTRNAIAQCVSNGVRNLLLTSSGAVYGPRFDPLKISEDDPLPSKTADLSAYAAGKMRSEEIIASMTSDCGLNASICRCFAFAGSYLPLRKNFAIGNFVYDAVRKKPIAVRGNGKSTRSYLYASDLVVWLLAALTRNSGVTTYNVGSSHEISISDLAKTISLTINGTENVEHHPAEVIRETHYVPNIDRIQKAFGLEAKISLTVAIERMARWARIENLHRGGATHT
jgi:UDP-glucuronate decarboxylase